MRSSILLAAFASLGLVACGGEQPLADVPMGTDVQGTDAARDVPSGTDAARDVQMMGTDVQRTDTGGTDPCVTDQAGALTTLGCNGGFASGTPAPNSPAGTCTGGGAAMPAGTCMGTMVQCSADTGMSGFCFPGCPSAGTYISRGGCPTGFRCFTLSQGGVCFRDCDATHPCPTGMECDGEGSCVPM